MKASKKCQDIMHFFKSIKQEEGVFKQKKNDIHPFDNQDNIVFLCEKNLSPLFCYGNHSKKKGDHLIFGRLFDSQILEMFELSLTKVEGNYSNALSLID